MNFYIIDPDVPGFLVEPWKAIKEDPHLSLIHYVFECCPKADLIQAYPVFLASARLAAAFAEAGLSGYYLKKCVGVKGEQFHIASPGCGGLPTYHWLAANGRAGVDDFTITNNLKLIVSENALNVMQGFNLERADISPA